MFEVVAEVERLATGPLAASFTDADRTRLDVGDYFDRVRPARRLPRFSDLAPYALLGWVCGWFLGAPLWHALVKAVAWAVGR